MVTTGKKNENHLYVRSEILLCQFHFILQNCVDANSLIIAEERVAGIVYNKMYKIERESINSRSG